MTAQIQLPVSAVLPMAFDSLPPDRVSERFGGEEPSEFALHLLAMEIVKHSPRTAERLAASGRQKMADLQ